MKIEITQAHINEAIRLEKDIVAKHQMLSQRCVVALALQEALNNPNIICGWTSVELDGENIGTLEGASDIVHAFDNKHFELLKPTTIEYTPNLVSV